MLAKLTPKKVEKAILKSYGILSEVARFCRCSRQAIYDFLNKKENEYLYDLLEQQNEAALDLSETHLLKQIKKGDTGAIRFHLSTKGKKRGYEPKVKIDNINKNVNLKDLSDEQLERLRDGEAIENILSSKA